MLYTDPVTFYSTLNNYRSVEYAQRSTWVFLQPADALFTHATSLVYGKDKELNPELCPKWKILEDVLQCEIPADVAKLEIEDAKVLILCQDRKTCFQLNNVNSFTILRFIYKRSIIVFSKRSQELLIHDVAEEWFKIQ